MFLKKQEKHRSCDENTQEPGGVDDSSSTQPGSASIRAEKGTKKVPKHEATLQKDSKTSDGIMKHWKRKKSKKLRKKNQYSVLFRATNVS